MSGKHLSQEEINSILSTFEEYDNTSTVAKLLNLSRCCVYSTLKKNGIKFSKENKRCKYRVNHNYFETIDSFEKAYFLGLIIADGCNIRKGMSIGLEWHDKHILEKFKNCIEYTGKLHFGKLINNNDRYILTIQSQKLSDDLTKLGCIPKKSMFAYFPDIEEKYWSHFIRGVFDGDGCIYVSDKTPKFSIIGNILLIEKIRDIISEKLNFKKTKLLHDKKSKENTVSVSFGGKAQLEKIRGWLYQDCEDLFLIRKKEKFDKIKALPLSERYAHLRRDYKKKKQ